MSRRRTGRGPKPPWCHLLRPRADILRFFDGFDLIDPGLVYLPEWRPDSPDDVPEDPRKFWGLVGVARRG